jgi:hypothetical protein
MLQQCLAGDCQIRKRSGKRLGMLGMGWSSKHFFLAVIQNLMFHSYLQLFSAPIRCKVPDGQLRRVTGHKTLAMSDN